MKPRGFTLLELMATLAILAIVATLALPSFAASAERARLKSAAETLASDLAEARFEAAQQGRSLYVEYGAGPAWCWAVTVSAGCSCGQAQPCQLKSVKASEHAGIELLQSQPAHLDAAGTAGAGGGALFQSSRGERLRVELSMLGRARICSPGGGVTGYAAC